MADEVAADPVEAGAVADEVAADPVVVGASVAGRVELRATSVTETSLVGTTGLRARLRTVGRLG